MTPEREREIERICEAALESLNSVSHFMNIVFAFQISNVVSRPA